MASPYDLLNSARVDFDTVSEARKIMEFAEGVVDKLIADLRSAAADPVTLTCAFLLLSYDKGTVGDPPEVGNMHLSSTVTEAIGEVITFPKPISTTEMLTAFLFDEFQVRATLMEVLIHLRQIEVEGTSRARKRALASSVKSLKALLGYALSAAPAN